METNPRKRKAEEQLSKGNKQVMSAIRSLITKKKMNVQRSRPEFKFIDTTAAISAATLWPLSQTTSTVVPVNLCTEGAGATNRVGRRIRMISFELHGSLSVAATTTGLAQQMKLELWYDNQTNGATPSGAAFYQSNVINSPRNLDNRDRFKKLKSFVFALGPATAANSSIASTQKINWYVRIPSKYGDTVYNGTNGGTIADINTGGLFLVANQDAFLGTATVTGNMYGRVRFTDV